MSFADAIRDGFSKYVQFSGRSSRAAYWWWFLFVVLASIVANIIDRAIGTQIVGVIVGLALLCPGLALFWRRMHDIGKSGVWILIALIPFVGAIVLLVFTLQPSQGPNQYGERPDVAAV